MKYTKEERLYIGQRIYENEISRYQAAESYGISSQTARDYMRMYRDANQLPPKHNHNTSAEAPPSQSEPAGLAELEAMTVETTQKR